MANLRAVQMAVRLSSPLKKGETPTITPLIDYMKAGHPIEGPLYRWLLRAITKDAGLPAVLDYVRHPNRPPSAETVATHVTAYHRIEELLEQPVTDKLCRYILGLIPGSDRRVERQGKSKRFTILDKDGADLFHWEDGEPMSREDAIRITAIEQNMSFSSVREPLRTAACAAHGDRIEHLGQAAEYGEASRLN